MHGIIHCVLFCVWILSLSNVSEIYSCFACNSYSLHCIEFHCMSVYYNYSLLILLLMNWFYFSYYKYCSYVHCITYLLGVDLGMEVLDHRPHVYSMLIVNCHVLFQEGCTDLHSVQHCMRVLVPCCSISIFFSLGFWCILSGVAL